MKKKRLFFYILILSCIYFFRNDIYEYVYSKAKYSYCEKPIGFYISEVDSKFGINKDLIIEQTKEAAQIWNKTIGKNLFEYDETKGLPITLKYDERQRLLTSISTETSDVESKKANLNTSIADFESKKETLTNQIDDLQKEINYWNDKGGAPKDIYDELTKKRDSLVKDIEKLNIQAENLNKTSSNVNSLISSLNGTITNFNHLLDVKPEGGLYYPQENKIEIYFYDNKNQYIHIAAHELGHALGLNHTNDENSIMAPIISDNLKPMKEDISELAEYCKDRNIIDDIKNKDLTYLVGLLREKLQ